MSDYCKKRQPVNHLKKNRLPCNNKTRFTAYILKIKKSAFVHTGKNGFFFIYAKLDFSKILNGTNHLAGVAVFVIIPRNNLYLIGIVVDLGNHGLGSVKQ